MMNSSERASLAHTPLADVVTHNSRAAAIFERYGLDYCCNGHQTVEDAAREHGVAPDEVVDALATLGAPASEDRDLDEWRDLDALTRHIVGHHHRYVREASVTINAWLDKLVARHGGRHPELVDVQQTFRNLSDEMATHMMKEENILFPCIDDLATASRAGAPLPMGPFGTILHPVRVMESDHQQAGELLGRLRTLTNGYTPPDDGCTTYRLCYAEFARFETDLHRHIHLENHILFPGALELERDLA